MKTLPWTCIQLGSREHYAVPCALHSAANLNYCITDTWLSKVTSRIVRSVLPSLAGRRDDCIPDSKVISNTIGRLRFDVCMKLGDLQYWESILKRNEWFGRWAASKLSFTNDEILFSYSHTALYPFRRAKNLGIRCILGQIDPGPAEDLHVQECTTQYRYLSLQDDKLPQKYWDLWREETALADKIVVNSPWSANLLLRSGIPKHKLALIPLVFPNLSPTSQSIVHRSSRRPVDRLQALFLGSLILRKGIGQLFDAIRLLMKEPIDFIFAGPVGVRIPDSISTLSQVRFLGPVDSRTAHTLYQEADVFLFPTLSDGFGLTQLEALSHGLPIIASTSCGQVVTNGWNGLVLEVVTPESIVNAILKLLHDPALLANFKVNACVPDAFQPRHLAPALRALQDI